MEPVAPRQPVLDGVRITYVRTAAQLLADHEFRVIEEGGRLMMRYTAPQAGFTSTRTLGLAAGFAEQIVADPGNYTPEVLTQARLVLDAIRIYRSEVDQ